MNQDDSETLPSDRPALTPAATILFEPDLALLETQLSALGRDGRRLFIVANGPVGDAVDRRLAALDNVCLIRLPANIGLGAALNIAMEKARDEGFAHILLMDQDSSPNAALPEALRARFEDAAARGGPLAVIAPMLVPPPGERYLPIRYAWRDRNAAAVQFAPTSGSLISVAAWSDIGPFRADYFVGGIDVEWGLRAWSKGYRSLVAPDLTMVHRWGTPVEEGGVGSPQILRQSDARNYYYIRNAVHGLKLRHVPVGWKLRSACNLLLQMIVLLAKRRFGKSTRTILKAALGDGMRNRLGPLDPVHGLPDLLPPSHPITSRSD